MKRILKPSSILEPVIAPLGRCLTPETARKILSIAPDKKARRRIEELAAKCDEGVLTADERAEYELFVDVGDLVALLQGKARRYLTKPSVA
jgi:hypothetical protein